MFWIGLPWASSLMGPRGASGISTFVSAARNFSRSSTLPPTALAASLIHRAVV